MRTRRIIRKNLNCSSRAGYGRLRVISGDTRELDDIYKRISNKNQEIIWNYKY